MWILIQDHFTALTPGLPLAASIKTADDVSTNSSFSQEWKLREVEDLESGVVLLWAQPTVARKAISFCTEAKTYRTAVATMKPSSQRQL